MKTLKVLIAATAIVISQAQAAPTIPQGLITEEVYLDIPGDQVSDLIGSSKFQNGTPDLVNSRTSFEYAAGGLDSTFYAHTYDNSGARMAGYFYPPTSGDYTFWIAADDTAILYLSTDENPAHKSQIASVPSWWFGRAYTHNPSQQSAPVSLIQGNVYYIEALMKENWGGEHVSVSIDGASPIPGSYLSPLGAVPEPSTCLAGIAALSMLAMSIRANRKHRA